MHGLAKPTPTEGLADGSRWNSPPAWLELREAVNLRLGTLVHPSNMAPVSLSRAVRHGLMAPGKRVRPLLTMLTAAEFGADPLLALDAGCAVELIHTASLVLDDLPCMDNASLRRGLPATHAVFGEATSVLAAIAMLTRAFGVIAAMERISDAQRVYLTAILSAASGADGLAAGQERDLNDRTMGDSLAKIDDINHLKTGALFIAAVEMGGTIAGVGKDDIAALGLLGREVGLAFQALDDVIDASQSTSEAGKDTAKDGGKATVATVLGLEPARAEVRRHMGAAIAAIEARTAPEGPLRAFVTAMFAEATAQADAKMGRCDG
jgi:geranylgeranyl diphosphate synthase type II